jgi:hypothetical protein
MNPNQATVGQIVRSNTSFAGVPEGTRGRIVEDYGTGVMVEWDIPSHYKPLVDGFDKDTELQFLDIAK